MAATKAQLLESFPYFAWYEVGVESGNTAHLTHFSLKPRNRFPFWRHGRRQGVLAPSTASNPARRLPRCQQESPASRPDVAGLVGANRAATSGALLLGAEAPGLWQLWIPDEGFDLPQPQLFGHRSIKSREARSSVPQSFPCTSGGDLTPTGRFSPPLSRHCAVVKSG